MINKLKLIASVIWYRVTEATPKLFRWFKYVGFLMLAYGFAVINYMPEVDFVVHVFREGMSYEKPLYFSQAISLLGLGFTVPASMVVKNFELYLEKIKSLLNATHKQGGSGAN